MLVRRPGGGWTKSAEFVSYGIRIRTRVVRDGVKWRHEFHARNFSLFDAEVLTHFTIPRVTAAAYAADPHDHAYESLRDHEWVRLWNLGDSDERACTQHGEQDILDPDDDIELIDSVCLAEHPGLPDQSRTLYAKLKARAPRP